MKMFQEEKNKTKIKENDKALDKMFAFNKILMNEKQYFQPN